MLERHDENPVIPPSWLVWAKSSETPLGPLLERFAQDEQTAVIKALGPPTAPHTLVVQMAVETAQHYQAELQDEFFLELNAPLSPQGDSS